MTKLYQAPIPTQNLHQKLQRTKRPYCLKYSFWNLLEPYATDTSHFESNHDHTTDFTKRLQYPSRYTQRLSLGMCFHQQRGLFFYDF